MPYHIRRDDREITDKSKLIGIIREGRYAVLALCNNNEPYVVTLSYGFDQERETLYFHSAGEGQKIDLLKENSRICLTILEDKGYVQNQCEHRYRSLIIRGNISFVDDPDEKLRGIEILLDQYHESRERMKKKINENSRIWQDTKILSLKIDDITGKERGF